MRLVNQAPVVFFDGECNLCNGFVDFVIRRDTKGRFRFSPLQGEAARLYSGQFDVADLSTVGLVDDDGVHTHSNAVLRVLVGLGGGYRLLGLLAFVVPRSLRDYVYRFVARHRYGWFGKRDSCRIPTAEEQTRFLS